MFGCLSYIFSKILERVDVDGKACLPCSLEEEGSREFPYLVACPKFARLGIYLFWPDGSSFWHLWDTSEAVLVERSRSGGHPSNDGRQKGTRIHFH